MRVKVTTKDLGWNHILRTALDSRRKSVDVGVRNGARRAGGPSNADIARWHEYGTRTVPARPHWRPAFDRNLRRYRRMGRSLMWRVAMRRMALRHALLQLGYAYRSDVQAEIRAHIPPPLAESTAAAKGSSTPLIDTAQYIQSFDVDVT